MHFNLGDGIRKDRLAFYSFPLLKSADKFLMLHMKTGEFVAFSYT